MKLPKFFRNPALAGALVGCALFGVDLAAVSLARAQNAAPAGERVIRITAKKFDFSPSAIVLKRGQPVVFELSSLDRIHGFQIKAFGVHAEILPGQTVRVRVTPDKAGNFVFACDLFCGSGHEDMNGTITVTD